MKVDVKSHYREIDGKKVLIKEHKRKVEQEPQTSIIGIPEKGKISEIPEYSGFTDMVIQRHDARRAGSHLDLRLHLNGVAHSWALRNWPKPGEIRLAIRQSDHSIEYSSFEGEIPEGYGAGKVSIEAKEYPEIIESSDSKIVFNVYKGKLTEEYVLIRTKDNNWIILNRSTTKDKFDLPKYKDSYKELEYSDEVADVPGIMQPKIDGAHCLILLEGNKRPRVFSYRESKKDDPLEYTHKIPKLYNSKVPKDVKRTILRGEVFLTDKNGIVLPAEQTAAVLNSGVIRAKQLQLGTGGLKVMPFDIHGVDLPYEERLASIINLTLKIPELMTPELAITKQQKLKMLNDIKSGKSKLTREGVVIWGDKTYKSKLVDDADVYIRDIFPGEGKYKDTHAGGFSYSMTPTGPIVGKVGTGFTDKERKLMMDNKNSLIGSVATVVYRKKLPSGALYAPSYFRMHPDKNESLPDKPWNEQSFSDGKKEWNVTDISNYAAMYTKPINLSVKELVKNNLLSNPSDAPDEIPGTPEFIQRAEKTDLRRPILAVEYPDGVFIADGVHRLWKANSLSKDIISAYLLKKEDLYKIPERHSVVKK